MAKNKRKIIILAAVIALIGVWIGVSRARSSGRDKPAIETARVERGSVTSTVSASGVLEPLTTVDVKSNAGGRVDMLAVDVGDSVTPGQLIAKIDPSDSQTAFNQAAADLSAADARLSQSKESLALQSEQSKSQIRQSEEALRSARARLAQAEAQAKVQPTLTRSSIKQAEANYKSAQQSLRQLKDAGIPLGKAQAKSAYDSAKASLDKAKRNLDRQQGLYDKGFISAGALDSAELEYKTSVAQAESAKERLDTVGQDYDAQLSAAQAKLDQASAALENAKANSVQDGVQQQAAISARAAVSQAEAELAATKSNARQIPIKAADIRSAQSQVVRNKAEVDNAQTQLNYTTITAPRGGVILKKYVEVGTIITSGRSSFAGTGEGTSVVQLGDLSRMFVKASVDETDISQVELGQEVDVTLDAYGDEKFEGLVTRIDPQTVSEQNVTTIPVTVEIMDADARLKPGMNATCDFIVQRKENVLTVPTEAVTEQNGRYTVSTMVAGEPVPRQVQVGVQGDETTEIVSGLKEGDEILASVVATKSSRSSSPFGQGGGPPPMMGGGPRR